MQTTLGILTALALAVSAFLGYKNMEKYREQIETRQAEESKRDNQLTPLLEKTRKERDLTETQKQDQQKAAEEKTAEVVAYKQKLDDLKREIANKENQVREQKASIDALADQLKELGDVTELANKMRRIKGEIEDLDAKIASLETELNNLIAEKNRTAAVIAGLEDENAWRNANLSNPKLETFIAAIYDTYGFITLPVGNNAGVVGGSSLDVVRDGEVIAKLLVKTVEDSTAAAEVIPNTLLADTVLMVGDKIRASAPTRPLAPAPAPVPIAPLEDEAPQDAPAQPDEFAPAEQPAEEDPFQ